MKRKLTAEPCLYLFILTMLMPQLGLSQRTTTPAFQFRDSLVGETNSYFLYATIHLDTTIIGKGASFVQLVAPIGWKVIGLSRLDVVKPTYNQGLLPVTLYRTRAASSNWSQLRLQVIDSFQQVIADTFLVLRAPPFVDFQIQSWQSQLELADTSHAALVDLRLQNMGTTTGRYQLTISRSGRTIVDKPLGVLNPGADSIYHLAVPLAIQSSDNQYRLLIQVKDSSDLLKAIPVELFRRYTTFKFHPSRYPVFPLSLEWGSFLIDKQIYSFVGAQSTTSIKEGTVSISFRSKTFGPLKTVEKNVFTVNVDKKKYFLAGGQLAESQHFYAYGSGGHFMYRIKPSLEVGGKAILHRSAQVIANDNFQVYIQQKRSKLSISHQLHFDNNASRHLVGYLFFNELIWKKSISHFVKVNIGRGLEQFRLQHLLQRPSWGWGGSASMTHHYKKWEFNGEFRYYQKSYPGLQKGFRSQFYDIRKGNEHAAWGVFYQYSFSRSPLLTDTVYLTDAFAFNIQKYGVRLSSSTALRSIAVSFGRLRQTVLNPSQLPRYTFLEVQHQWRSMQKLSVQFTSIGGFAGTNVSSAFTWFTNSSLDIKWNQVGVRGFFTQTPVLRDSSIKVLARYSQTLLVNPYLSLQLFKRVRSTLRYTFSKSLQDKKIIQGIGFSFLFRNGRGDWQLQCNGTIPLSATTVSNYVPTSYSYVTVSVRKDLSIPFLFKKRYHQLNVQAFEDKNANNLFDADEQGVPQLHFLASETRFRTDSLGVFQLKNVDTGAYAISLETVPEQLGLIPAMGSQSIHLSKNSTLLFPLRKGNAISGQVKIERDPYSTKKYSVENTLITIVEEGGEKFTAITDSAGRFYKILPAGRYTVSLTKEAFTGALRPVQESVVVDLMRISFGRVEFVLRERKREIRYKGDY